MWRTSEDARLTPPPRHVVRKASANQRADHSRNTEDCAKRAKQLWPVLQQSDLSEDDEERAHDPRSPDATERPAKDEHVDVVAASLQVEGSRVLATALEPSISGERERTQITEPTSNTTTDERRTHLAG